MSAHQPPYRVLVVEDDVFDAKVAVRALKEDQFQVDVATTLTAALERAQRERFDLILLDLNLPDAWPNVTFERFDELALDTPVVVLSGAKTDVKVMSRHPHAVRKILLKGSFDYADLGTILQAAIAEPAGIRSSVTGLA